MSKNFKSLQEEVAEKLIAALQAGTSPFQKPWTDNNSAGYVTPFNPTTGQKYRGINAFWLAMQGRDDPRWMTFKQAAAQKWMVMKGSKSTMITYVKKFEIIPVLDEKGKPVLGPDGKPKTEKINLDRPMFINAYVFNAEQISGIPELELALAEKQTEQQWSAIERADQIITASQAVIRHGGNEAYYTPGYDRIQIPKKIQFAAAAKYYATLLHELGHWSGHESRLNRDLLNKYGSPDYAKEELRAEIASLMMGSELDIGHNFGQHAAYVNSWIKVLKDDPAELFKAAADAQHITEYLLAFEQKRELAIVAAEGKAALLSIGDQIAYKDTVYRVLVESTAKICYVQDLNSGRRIKFNTQDGLYTSLLQAKNDPERQQCRDELSAQSGLELEGRGYG